jgi:hypothetical protein
LNYQVSQSKEVLAMELSKSIKPESMTWKNYVQKLFIRMQEKEVKEVIEDWTHEWEVDLAQFRSAEKRLNQILFKRLDWNAPVDYHEQEKKYKQAVRDAKENMNYSYERLAWGQLYLIYEYWEKGAGRRSQVRSGFIDGYH